MSGKLYEMDQEIKFLKIENMLFRLRQENYRLREKNNPRPSETLAELKIKEPLLSIQSLWFLLGVGLVLLGIFIGIFISTKF